MDRNRFDKGFWIVAISVLLVLSSISLLFCPTAHAGDEPAAAPAAIAALPVIPAPHGTPTEAAKSSETIDTDDDGNELLEHWSDPKFGREERLQTVGILGFLTLFGTASAIRRQALRRVYIHG